MIAGCTFAALPYGAVSDQRLSEIDLKVLAGVASHDRFGKNGQGCWANRDTLAHETGFNSYNVSSSLSKLVQLGYLTASASKKDGRKRSYSVVYGANGRFARIPIRAVSDRRLNKTLFRTLAAVSAHDPGDEKGCFASVSTLAKSTCVDTKAIELGIAGLVAIGYIFATLSPVHPFRRRLYIAAWREDASPQDVAANSAAATETSEYDFDAAIRERLPYGVPRPFNRLPADSTFAQENSDLGKSLYWSEDLHTKNPAKAGVWREKISSGKGGTEAVDSFNETIRAFGVEGVNLETAWAILQKLSEMQLAQLLSKVEDGSVTQFDLTEARRLAAGVNHLN